MIGNESSGDTSRRRRTVWPRRALGFVIMLTLAAPLIACRPGALSLQDYQRDILSVGMAAVLDWVIPVRERTITERHCYENQGGTLVEIDCSKIPTTP